MSGIVNSGYLFRSGFPGAPNTPIKQKAALSLGDWFKSIIYSVLSCFAPRWATNKLSNLHAKYVGPNTGALVANVKNAEESLKVLSERKNALGKGDLLYKIIEKIDISESEALDYLEDAIEFLASNDSLWSEDPLANAVFDAQGKVDWKPKGEIDRFISSCREALKKQKDAGLTVHNKPRPIPQHFTFEAKHIR